ncbi:MAG: hypothetical protein CBC48_04050 [bacterium TMED88]|nr:hypothetical protein [Deltaproteobacteria bacterium]OUV35441.1 MAG: hypothetical protein CBC48_04050 [bacterium TMED88]
MNSPGKGDVLARVGRIGGIRQLAIEQFSQDGTGGRRGRGIVEGLDVAPGRAAAGGICSLTHQQARRGRLV